MLIRNILEESVRKFDEVKAVKWLKKKEIMERSYGELMENVVSTRKGLLAEGFEGKHIALIGTSSVEWMESYLGIITGCTTAVPLVPRSSPGPSVLCRTVRSRRRARTASRP